MEGKVLGPRFLQTPPHQSKTKYNLRHKIGVGGGRKGKSHHGSCSATMSHGVNPFIHTSLYASFHHKESLVWFGLVAGPRSLLHY